MDIQAFISHSYKSPQANLYFFETISQNANFYFSVDIGIKSTNVTRLERMIRSADLFIGIFSISSDPEERERMHELRLKKSRYFRLELDIATRFRKPMLIYLHEDFRDVLPIPTWARIERFRDSDIKESGRGPRYDSFNRAAEKMVGEIKARKCVDLLCHQVEPDKVAIIVPSGWAKKNRYSRPQMKNIAGWVADQWSHEPIILEDEPIFDGQLKRSIAEWDWIVTDIGPNLMYTGAIGHLHAMPVPMLRLAKGFKGMEDLDRATGYNSLIGKIDAGYSKDIVYWRTNKDLEGGISNRISIIDFPTTAFTEYSDAKNYFNGAAKRNDPIFVSYSGEDENDAQEIISELKNRYQQVFDYKDNSSIAPGEPWVPQIYEKLVKSAIGIPLLSKSYLESGHCAHELQQMIAQKDDKKMLIFPIKMHREDLSIPSWAQSTQYIRRLDFSSARQIIDRIQHTYNKWHHSAR